MNDEMIKKLEDLMKDFQANVEVHFEHKMVAFYDIIKSRQGPLNLDNKRIVGQHGSKQARRIANQRILEQYLSETGMTGWELVTAFDYDGLPHHGCLVFKKRYYVEKETPEESTVTADFKENLSAGNMYQEFENETGKHAVWQRKETKAFVNWKRSKKNEVLKKTEEEATE